jgi:hypothetical protein
VLIFVRFQLFKFCGVIAAIKVLRFRASVYFLELEIMTIEQIKSILAGAEESLRLLHDQPEYLALENSEFATENDLVLGDAIQCLSEIYQAIVECECDFVDAIVSIPDPETQVHQNLFDW